MSRTKRPVVSPWLILLLFVGIVPLIPLLTPGMFVAHDAQDHVARIANFYQNIKEGVLIPRWAGNLNWGYGHPILMFLYPMSSYVATLFIFLGFSLVDSTKIVFAFGFIVSGLTMYRWIRELWGEQAGFAAGLVYMFAPYRFVDLYVRGAIGENFFFIFPPLVCFFLTKLSKRLHGKFIAGGCLAIAGMILSHNALTLMFLPIIIGYSLILSMHQRLR
ncbi:hypothetical protein HY468_03760, partial [Candidatus Roizmanbacteria bacterium]|nr:hypothetical protein [Candidatus Roizmanbacteria bacterium]